MFGEIVDLYWRRSEANLALELEACWNELRASTPFPLLCGYELAPGRERGTHLCLPRDGSRGLTQLGHGPDTESTQAEPPSIPTYTLNDGNTLPAIGFGT